jgi:hypothetical protein
MKPRDINEPSAHELLEWSRNETPLTWVNTATDAIPGGLSMAMSPVLVNWSASTAGPSAEASYLLHNVNLSSNPIAGATLLGSIRVEADSIERAEYVTVLSKVGRFETDAGHAMLRFVFKEGRNPHILGNNGEPLSENARLADLLFSWEAWRPPGAGFDPFAGLDPSQYSLTMRCFNGPSRCLTDSLLDRPWVCYPLNFPDVPEAMSELLHVTLLLGDSVARQTIGTILDEKIAEAHGTPEDYPDAAATDWSKLKSELQHEAFPEEPIQEILHGRYRYHTVLRSCVTMALTTVDWANVRIHYDADLQPPRRVRVAPTSLPSFFDKWNRGDRSRALLRIPGALHWLVTNQTVIPGKAHELLDEVGLLQHKDDQLVRTHYDNREESAYGHIRDSIIY